MNIVPFSFELAQSFYTAADEFPVDFDSGWVWLGYSAKQMAEKQLFKHFEQGTDFLICGLKSPNGGRPSKQIKISVNCFKELGMMAGTEKGKEVRKYFLECERRLKQVAQPNKAEEIAKNQPQSQIEIILASVQQLAATAQQMAEQEQRLLRQEHIAQELSGQLEATKDELKSRIESVEFEQDRFYSPSGHKYTILGFAKKQGLEISLNQSKSLGSKASSLCKTVGIAVERINDPRFGSVGLYPESILIQVFG